MIALSLNSAYSFNFSFSLFSCPSHVPNVLNPYCNRHEQGAYMSPVNPSARTWLFDDINVRHKERNFLDELFLDRDELGAFAAESERLQDLGQRIRRARKTAKSIIKAMPYGLFRHTCHPEIALVIDTNRCMKSFLEEVASQIINIVSELHGRTLHEYTGWFVIVAYKDHDGTGNHIKSLSFTSDLKHIYTFLNSLEASGGRDGQAQDVLGALDRAAGFFSPSGGHLIHITDTPPHGHHLQNNPWEDDRYLTPGSEPHGLEYRMVLKKLLGMNVHYTLLRVNNDTDRMAQAFCEVYASFSPTSSIHSTNMFARLQTNPTTSININTGTTPTTLPNTTLAVRRRRSSGTEVYRDMKILAKFSEKKIANTNRIS